MRRLFAVTVLLGLFASVAVAQTSGAAKDRKRVGVGTWTLDKAASDFGQVPSPKSVLLHVTKCSADGIAYTASVVDADGKKIEETWSGKPDGKMSPAKTVPASKEQASFEWQGDLLLAKFDMGAEGTAEEHISFSEDGNTMTVKRTGKSPKGEFGVTEVFKRKSAATGKSSAAKKRPAKAK